MGVALNDLGTAEIGEGISDGLNEVVDALDGDRPKAVRPVYDMPDLLSALDVSFSKDARGL